MEDDTPGSRKRGMFGDISFDPLAKRARTANPEFLAAFRAFDADLSGSIDVGEVGAALQAVQGAVQAGAAQVPLFQRPLNPATCSWLCAKFGGGARLDQVQFCDLLGYLGKLREIFEQVDADRSGTIECGELHRAFRLSGIDIDERVVTQVGQAYDGDRSGKLEFDEFVQMRMEWDCYIDAWDQCTQGLSVIKPEQLLGLLEGLKRSLEPVGSALVSQANVPVLTSQGLFFTSMFKASRPFQARTCECLIIHFSKGEVCLNFGQFCSMMVFLKGLKTSFCQCDENVSGSLNVSELARAFAGVGMQLPPELVVKIGQMYDQDKSGEIEFDEFVQMAVEWNDMCQEQARFAAQAASGVSATALQEFLGQVRVIYRVVNGAVVTLRPFSLQTCKRLVAKFGTPGPGQACAQALAWEEMLRLVQYVREAFARYSACDVSKGGSVTAQELAAALAACGLVLSSEAVNNIRSSYDADGSGAIEFDEFIQLLVECQLYEQSFDAGSAQLARAGAAAPGLVTLDKSAFFALVFAVPRQASA